MVLSGNAPTRPAASPGLSVYLALTMGTGIAQNVGAPMEVEVKVGALNVVFRAIAKLSREEVLLLCDQPLHA